jgi:hypothetical protein
MTFQVLEARKLPHQVIYAFVKVEFPLWRLFKILAYN